jgi:hypothetical protein
MTSAPSEKGGSMTDPNTPLLLATGDETLRKILDLLSVEFILTFREKAKVIHQRQLGVINEVLIKKGYVEPHLSTPAGGYHD